MNIAVLSGKGGTGKTTISTNLALALKANYIDCDVEEPNGFLFLKPDIYKTKSVMVEYPAIDYNKCILCGACVDVCQFNALAKTKNEIILFEKLCHGCGACKIACKNDAIEYKMRDTGKIEKGKLTNIKCSRGILNVGEPMAVPVIRELLKELNENMNLIDCPPGTSCNVVNALKYASGSILVTEPTEFGLHDLKMAVELVRMYKIPFGIIINKDYKEDNIVKKYCREENIQLIGSLLYSKDIAKIYSKGEILYRDIKYREIFDRLANKAMEVLLWS